MAAQQKEDLIKALVSNHKDRDILRTTADTLVKRILNRRPGSQVHVSTTSACPPDPLLDTKSFSIKRFPAVMNPEVVQQVLFIGLIFHHTRHPAQLVLEVAAAQLMPGKGSIAEHVFTMSSDFGEAPLCGTANPVQTGLPVDSTGASIVLNSVCLIETLRQLQGHVKYLLFYESSGVFADLIAHESVRTAKASMHGSKRPFLLKSAFKVRDLKERVYQAMAKEHLLDNTSIQQADQLSLPSAASIVKRAAVVCDQSAFDRAKQTAFVFDRLRKHLLDILV